MSYREKHLKGLWNNACMKLADITKIRKTLLSGVIALRISVYN